MAILTLGRTWLRSRRLLPARLLEALPTMARRDGELIVDAPGRVNSGKALLLVAKVTVEGAG
jgi:hypothetical protein